MKQIVRLTESDLHRLIKESVGRVLREYDENMDDESNEDLNLNIYKEQLKEIIELNLLNKNNINETLRKTFEIVLNIINEK